MKRALSLPGSALALVVAVTVTGLPAAQGAFVTVYGGPAYDQTTSTGLSGGGIDSPLGPGSGVNNTGTAVGYASKYVGGIYKGERPVRWDASGAAATELGILGTDGSGNTDAYACAVNNAGTAVGYSYKYDSGGQRQRGVRWNASGTAATELGNLGTNYDAYAFAINDAGTAVGYVGNMAVRWDASGTAATELEGLGSVGIGYVSAVAVNDAGTAVGYAYKYDGGSNKGERAARWDASGIAVTELGILGTDSSGTTYARAWAVNSSGTAVGSARKYVGGVNTGNRAVRWDASGIAATELGDLGMDSYGDTAAEALAVNNAGTAVGYAVKYVSGVNQGSRAVRWDASGTAATELGDLGTDSFNRTSCTAYDVNNDGVAVGCANVNGSSSNSHAVLWGASGQAVDLNTRIDPNSGWTLAAAKAISSNGLWISGEGTYDPDGTGPLAAYGRLWTIHFTELVGDTNGDGVVDVLDLNNVYNDLGTQGVGLLGDTNSDNVIDVNDLNNVYNNLGTVAAGAEVPEPATLSLLALGGLAMIRRRRKSPQNGGGWESNPPGTF